MIHGTSWRAAPEFIVIRVWRVFDAVESHLGSCASTVGGAIRYACDEASMFCFLITIFMPVLVFLEAFEE